MDCHHLDCTCSKYSITVSIRAAQIRYWPIKSIMAFKRSPFVENDKSMGAHGINKNGEGMAYSIFVTVIGFGAAQEVMQSIQNGIRHRLIRPRRAGFVGLYGFMDCLFGLYQFRACFLDGRA